MTFIMASTLVWLNAVYHCSATSNYYVHINIVLLNNLKFKKIIVIKNYNNTQIIIIQT